MAAPEAPDGAALLAHADEVRAGERGPRFPRRILLARFLSQAGTEVAYVGMLTAIFGVDASALLLAVALALSMLTRAIAAPLGGLLGDRFGHRTTMVVSDVASGLAALAMALAEPGPWLIAGIGLLALLAGPFFANSFALVVDFVGPRGAARANGWLAASASAGALVGLAAGGWFVETAGAQPAFVVNAVTHVGSGLLVLSIARRRFVEHRQTSRLPSPLVGLHAIRADGILRILVGWWAMTSLAAGVIVLGELPLAYDLGGGPAVYGVMVALWSAGQLLCGLVVGRLLRFGSELRPGALATLLWGVVLVVIGANELIGVALALFFLAGVFEQVVVTVGQTLSQHRAPAANRAAVIGAVEAIHQLGMAVGVFLGAGCVALAGAGGTYVIAGAIALPALLFVLVAAARQQREGALAHAA